MSCDDQGAGGVLAYESGGVGVILYSAGVSIKSPGRFHSHSLGIGYVTGGGSSRRLIKRKG